MNNKHKFKAGEKYFLDGYYTGITEVTVVKGAAGKCPLIYDADGAVWYVEPERLHKKIDIELLQKQVQRNTEFRRKIQKEAEKRVDIQLGFILLALGLSIAAVIIAALS